MEPETRTPKQIILLGTNGTGKSTTSKRIVINGLKEKQRVLIVTPDDREWNTIPWAHQRFPNRIGGYVGARKVIYDDGLLDIIWNNFFDGLVIFDDCRGYFDDHIPPMLKTLMVRRRQNMIDLVFCAHGFTDVPPKAFAHSTQYILFKTIDAIEDRKKHIIDYPSVLEARTRINDRANDTSKAWTKSGKIEDNIHYCEIIKV
jgi:hypothetical protein